MTAPHLIGQLVLLLVSLSGPADTDVSALYPDADAVVMRHGIVWTLEDDGSVIHEEFHTVKLLHERAWRRYSDPRVDFADGRDEVAIERAHTRIGEELIEIPDYGINVVSPRGLARFPAYAAWREQVHTFSGVADGAILELHYRKSMPPGAFRWFEGDVRIGGEDPILHKTVTVNFPKGHVIHHHVDGILDGEVVETDGSIQWRFTKVPAMHESAKAPPWQARCGRIRWSDAPTPGAWLDSIVSPVRQAVDSGRVPPAMQVEIDEWTKEAAGTLPAARAVAKALAGSFIVVDDARTWRDRRVRSIEQVYEAGYGSWLEAAALTAKALEGIGIETRLVPVMDGRWETSEVRVESEFEGLLVESEVMGERVLINPKSGGTATAADWPDGRVWRQASERGEGWVGSDLCASPCVTGTVVEARLTFDPEGDRLTGRVFVVQTGELGEVLQSDDDARGQSLRRTIAGYLGKAEISDISVAQIGPHRIDGEAKVEIATLSSKDAPAKLFAISTETPGLAGLSVPLHRRREVPLAFDAGIDDRLDLTLIVPEGWVISIRPEDVEASSGAFGAIGQRVEPGDAGLRVLRTIKVSRRVEVGEHQLFDGAVRKLTAPGASRFVIERAGPDGDRQTEGTR